VALFTYSYYKNFFADTNTIINCWRHTEILPPAESSYAKEEGGSDTVAAAAAAAIGMTQRSALSVCLSG